MNYLLWVSFLSLFILGFGDNVRGPLFPEIINTFQLSDSSAAWYFALSSFMSFIGSFLVRKLKSVSQLLYVLYAGVMCIFISFVIQHFAKTYALVLFGVVFFGLSVGFLGVTQNSLVILGTTPKNRSRMLAILHSMYGTASLIAPLCVAMMSNLKWQTILMNFSWIALLFSGSALFFHSRKKQSIGHFSQFQDADHSRLESWRELKISLVISLYVLAEIMLGTRIAQYMRRYYDYDLAGSSLFVTMFFIFVLVGRVVTSFVPHHYNIKKQLLFSLGSSSVFIVAALFIHPYAFFLVGFSMAPFYPLGMSYISQLFPKKSTTIVSWTLIVQGFLIVLMHLGIGKLSDLIGLNMALLLGPVCLLVSLAILLSIKETEHA